MRLVRWGSILYRRLSFFLICSFVGSSRSGNRLHKTVDAIAQNASMATTKPKFSNFTDVRPDTRPALDVDGDSVVSFASGPVPHRKEVKFAWGPNEKVNHEQFQRMLNEYREAKRRELDLELKAKQ